MPFSMSTVPWAASPTSSRMGRFQPAMLVPLAGGRVGANIAGDLKEELTHFVNCALQGKTPLVTGEDGVRSLELAWAIQKSIDTGEVIKFEE